MNFKIFCDSLPIVEKNLLRIDFILIVQNFFGIFASPKSNEIQSFSVFKIQFL
tara:strand:- start:6007 stop:6165 length:159 start_codon:yes stop_codon:yes gene_type:complete